MQAAYFTGSQAALGGRQCSAPLSGRTGVACTSAPAAVPRSRTRVHVTAFAGSSNSWPVGSWHGAGTYERVLRYPDGKERRIRYPLPPSEDPRCEDLTDGCWADSCWEPRDAWVSMRAASGGAAAVAAAPPAALVAPAPPHGTAAGSPPGAFVPEKLAEPERQRMPASPMELLRYLNSPEYKKAQEEQWERVRGSYEVLDQVPWIAPKPLFMLAVEQAPAAGTGELRPGLTYSLRTRVARGDTEGELSKVLRRRAPDGSPLIRCSEMKDGVVAFEDEADAERYGQMLEAEGAEVSVARCDSHELFRSVQDVRAVVVLLRRGGALLPQPHQLATSLRSQPESGGAAGSGQPMFD